MLEFGKYTLKYEPPTETPEDHSVAMTISSEANLPQMLEFFSSFLRAAGYEFDGKELCLEREAPDFSFLDGYSFGSHYAGPFGAGASFKGAEGAQATGGIGGKGAE